MATTPHVARDGGRVAETIRVWYNGAAGAITKGCAVCYDPTAYDAEKSVPGTQGTWNNEDYFQAVEQPATINLAFFAGVVVSVDESFADNSAFITIAVPRRGSKCVGLVLFNSTAAGLPLTVTDGEWHLVTDGTADVTTVKAITAEIKNNASAALMVITGIT